MATKEKRQRLTSPIGTLSFEHVWEPHAMEEGKEKKYSAVLVWGPDKADELKDLKRACLAAAEEKFGPNVKDLIKKGKVRMPWRPASDYEDYGAPFDQEGAVFAAFQSKTPPGVVDKRAKPITNQNDVYSGCKVRVTYGVWAYDTNGNKGVTLLLNNVQKAGDGERLSGRADAEDDFDAIDGDDSDDDDDLDI